MIQKRYKPYRATEVRLIPLSDESFSSKEEAEKLAEKNV